MSEPHTLLSRRLQNSSFSPFVRWFAVLTVVLSLAACDGSDLTGPTRNADGDVTIKEVIYSQASATGLSYGTGSARSTGEEFGCSGGIWNQKKGRYDEITIKLNLPSETIEAANGRRYEPRFALNDPADVDRLLMGVVCTLPDVQDPRIEKAHAKIGRLLAKEVRKLQRDLDALVGQADGSGARASMAVSPDASGSTDSPPAARAQSGENCSVQMIAEYYVDGIRIRVYDLVCSGSGGSSTGGGTPVPGGEYPPYCSGQFMQTSECVGFETEAMAEAAWRAQQNPEERRLCLSSLYRCGLAWESHRAAERYEDILHTRYPMLDYDNSPVNARKHAYWSAHLSITQGVSYAKAWTDAHELPALESLGSSNPDLNMMDFYNNGVGRTVALRIGSVNNLTNGIEAEFNAGHLRLYSCGGFPGLPGSRITDGFCDSNNRNTGNPNYSIF